MRRWAEDKHGLSIEVHDLHGAPRIRKRGTQSIGI
jgi:hypothetical protein